MTQRANFVSLKGLVSKIRPDYSRPWIWLKKLKICEMCSGWRWDNAWKSGQAIPLNGRAPSFYKRHAITGWKKKDGSTDRCVLEVKIQSEVKIVSSQTDLQFGRAI